MAFNCLKATEPLQIDSLLFTTKSPGVPGTYLINLRNLIIIVQAINSVTGSVAGIARWWCGKGKALCRKCNS